MIAGIFHPGSGLGNQLFRYVATRTLALDKGYDFSMVAPENFKGKSFIDLNMGREIDFSFETDERNGKITVKHQKTYMGEEESWGGIKYDLWEEKTNYYNPEFNFIEDNTIIDGEFQSTQYFWHRMQEIDEWLNVSPVYIPDDTCVIGFRGGEFYVFPELGLPLEYWHEAIMEMDKINPKVKYEVHTDDEVLARKFFPDFKIIHDIGINWRSMRYAKHAIIANSSFYILPRLLSNGITISPRYWARRNTGEWSRPDNYYSAFKYI